MSKLDVSSNEICGKDKWGNGKYDPTGLTALMKAISKLKELNISNNLLGAEGAAIVAPALEDNGALVNLNVSNNGLGPEGAQALVPAM